MNAPARGATKKILIISSEKNLADSLERSFCWSEFVFKNVENPQAGIALLADETDYLALILDSDGTGFGLIDVVEQLRKQHIQLPIANISDRESFDNAQKLLFQDEIESFHKPVNIEHLMTYLRRRSLIDDIGIRFFPGMNNLKNLIFDMEFRTDEINPTQVSNFVANLLFLTKFCHEKSMTKIEIAIHEAIVNAVDHGNLDLDSSMKPKTLDDDDGYYMLRCSRIQSNEYAGLKVKIGLRAQGSVCKVTISDQGKGFDHCRVMEELRKERDPAKLLQAHGRGLVLIMYSVDDVQFNESGNSITLVLSADGNNE